MKGVVHLVEPQHRKAAARDRRPHIAKQNITSPYLGPFKRADIVESKLNDPFAGGGAVLHAAHHLLPHITALRKINPLQRVHIGFMGKGIAQRIILAAFGNAGLDAALVIER